MSFNQQPPFPFNVYDSENVFWTEDNEPYVYCIPSINNQNTQAGSTYVVPTQTIQQNHVNGLMDTFGGANTATSSTNPSSPGTFEQGQDGTETEAYIIKVDDRRWKCTLCKKILPRKDRAREHADAHNGRKPFLCSGKCGVAECGFSGVSKDKLKVHIEHKQFWCDICFKYFSMKNRARHNRLHSQSTSGVQQDTAQFHL